MKRIFIVFLGLLFLSLPSFADEISPEEFVKRYIDELYDGYLRCEPKDISSYLDLEQNVNQNFAQSYPMLNARRAYLKEKDYCYVETTAFPLEVNVEGITYPDENVVEVTFDLVGDRNLAYPPFIYLGRNCYQLVRSDDGWKLSKRFHEDVNFYEDQERVITSELPFETRVEAMKKSIDEEFEGEKMPLFDSFFPAHMPKSNPLNYLVKEGDYPYNTERALKFIDKHIYETADEFIRLQENCANFSSQILYRGFFGNEYKEIYEWNGHYGEFSHCWIYAGLLGDYMTRPRYDDEEGPRSELHDKIYQLRQGGIIEVKGDPGESWAHVMQLRDYQKMIFSGNNYDGYRYYSDLGGFKRLFSPLYFRFQ